MEVKKARLAELQALLREQAEAISAAMVGSLQTVLVTGRSKNDANEWQARTENNRVVNFAPAAGAQGLDGPEIAVGQLLPMRIEQAFPNSLRGVLQA